MVSDHKKHRDEIFNAMNGIADSVFEISDDEIEAEMQQSGDDTEHIRTILLNAVKTSQQQALHEAKEQYKISLRSYQERSFELPQAPSEKRNLIQSMWGSLAQGQQQLTAQFRDFESLPDEDLDGVLLQLFALQSDTQSEE